MRRSFGFTFIELMIAVGLVGIFVPAIMKVLSFSLREARQGEQYSIAWSIARDAMENKMAVKTTWANLTNGTVTSSQTKIGTSYARTVTVADAYRCNSTTICKSTDPGAVLDTFGGKKITVTVNWTQDGGAQFATLSAYVTPH